MIRPSHKSNGSRTPSPANNNSNSSATVAVNNGNGNNGGVNRTEIKQETATFNDVINNVIERSVKKEIKTEPDSDSKKPVEAKQFVRKFIFSQDERPPFCPRFMTMTVSKSMYPGVPHEWLCEGRLLHLLDSEHPGNYQIFQVCFKLLFCYEYVIYCCYIYNVYLIFS